MIRDGPNNSEDKREQDSRKPNESIGKLEINCFFEWHFNCGW